ncbi:ATP12-domain-containing protein [Polyplosphaeria fusca]|uniref:ATP12-domain-containing protein n=1 Tax=Polyplosphaeria fusca TaxID=682080 RepID=A0A9P4QLY8_9PLEO|nr:ATP12-domain-containing protein [Polyplosphaeria fusca]
MDALRPALVSLRLSVSASRTAPRPLSRCLHLSASRCATPHPHPSVPGPPPKSPAPAASDSLERIARKRRQAELLKSAQELKASPSKPRYALQKRFWKDVSVKETPDGFHVFLDSRPVRTPSKGILTVPLSKHQLATAIALEWDLVVSAQQALKTEYIPMTSLTSRALDIVAADTSSNTKLRQDIITMLMRYLSTDTLLCWAPEKNLHDPSQSTSLRQLQQRISEPILSYLTTHVWPGVVFTPILQPDSILPVAQSDMTLDVVRGWLSGLPAFELAGLERAVLAGKSLLVGARLVHEWGEAFAQSRLQSGAIDATGDGARFGIEEAAEACSTEVSWQTGQWGEVEDTHDVEKEDMRRQFGSALILVSGDGS